MERFIFAKTLIVEAGKIANDYFKKVATLTVKSKGSHDLVSEADLSTERFIKEKLEEAFPEDSFFGEEMVSIGFSPRSPHSFLFDSLGRLLDKQGMFFRNGSGALSLAYVGAGRLLGHVEPHIFMGLPWWHRHHRSSRRSGQRLSCR